MRWPQKDAIADGVVEMLKVNLGLSAGETLVVVSDVPRVAEWQNQRPSRLRSMLTRAMLGRLVAAVAAERFADSEVAFYPFPSAGGHSAEPGAALAERLQAADVAVALTTYSLSHTDAREAATEAGVRLASMPGFETRMLEAGGPLAVDHKEIARHCQVIADRLTAAEHATVRTLYGTDLTFSLKGRRGQVDNGLYGTAPGMWGNLPAGETYAVPLEGTGQGRLVVPAGWYPELEADMTFTFEAGEVVELAGGGAVGDEFRDMLQLGSDDPAARRRRNLAELGIGTNPNAKRPDNVLEAEKIKGTVHIAIGDNSHMGGTVEADLHEDFVQTQPDLILDGDTVIKKGAWRW
jgi:leucyl aminopeptidase (aminopeptidase T)